MGQATDAPFGVVGASAPAARRPCTRARRGRAVGTCRDARPSIGARRILLVATVAANTVLELSSAVGDWWGRSTASSTSLPPVVRNIVESRPETSEGDVHLVMWFVAAAVLVLAVRRWRHRLIGLGAMWLYSWSLEILQSTFTPTVEGSGPMPEPTCSGIASAGRCHGRCVDAVCEPTPTQRRPSRISCRVRFASSCPAHSSLAHGRPDRQGIGGLLAVGDRTCAEHGDCGQEVGKSRRFAQRSVRACGLVTPTPNATEGGMNYCGHCGARLTLDGCLACDVEIVVDDRRLSDGAAAVAVRTARDGRGGAPPRRLGRRALEPRLASRASRTRPPRRRLRSCRRTPSRRDRRCRRRRRHRRGGHAAVDDDAVDLVRPCPADRPRSRQSLRSSSRSRRGRAPTDPRAGTGNAPAPESGTVTTGAARPLPARQRRRPPRRRSRRRPTCLTDRGLRARRRSASRRFRRSTRPRHDDRGSAVDRGSDGAADDADDDAAAPTDSVRPALDRGARRSSRTLLPTEAVRYAEVQSAHLAAQERRRRVAAELRVSSTGPR